MPGRSPWLLASGRRTGPWFARRVVLAAGGMALPRSGSDGHGYTLARSLGHSVTTVFPALVRDRSVDGLSLRLDWPVEVGSVLWLQPEDAGRWVSLEVRHCRPHARGWLVGCQFDHADGRSALALRRGAEAGK